jgi:hypothetical protein
MNENIYVSEKLNASNKKSIMPVLTAIIIILVLVFGILLLLNNKNTGTNSTDNSNISTATTTPGTSNSGGTVTPEFTETPAPGDTSSPAPIYTATPTPTLEGPTLEGPTPTGTPVKMYFYKSPLKPMQPVDEVYAFNRYTMETNLVPFAIGQIFKGPTTEEKAAGYILPFSLSGSSTCGESSYKFTYDATTVKLNICKDIDTFSDTGDGGAYAGSGLNAMARVLKVLTSSIKVGSITKVEVYDKTGACYAPDSGQNGCAP